MSKKVCPGFLLGEPFLETQQLFAPPAAHIFIGSSSEGLTLAKEIKPHLTSIGIVDVWDKDVFTLGTGTLEALFLKLRRSDFAILVCTPDDKIVSRGRSTGSMRDNVLFELGLFMGGLGRSRAYGVLYRPDVLKLPSDLFGITLVPVKPVKSDKKKKNLPISWKLPVRLRLLWPRRSHCKSPSGATIWHGASIVA